jgi:hypothetical protein
VSGADQHRYALPEPQLHPLAAAGAIRPSGGSEPNSPAAVVEQRPVTLDLETDDVAESATTTRAQPGQLPGRSRRATRHPDATRPPRERSRRRRRQSTRAGPEDRAVEALRLVEARHWPFHAGFRRSMNAATPSRKSSLV